MTTGQREANEKTLERIKKVIGVWPQAAVWVYRPGDYESFEAALKQGAAYKVESLMFGAAELQDCLDGIKVATRCIGGTRLSVRVDVAMEYEVYPLGEEPK